jgi:hypothetical protein
MIIKNGLINGQILGISALKGKIPLDIRQISHINLKKNCFQVLERS